jgi:predicted permease
METTLRDLRHTLRTFLKNPGFTIIAIGALALGIGANTAIFSVVNAVLLQPLPYPEPDRLVFVQRQFRDDTGNATSVPKFNVWREQSRVLDDICAYDFAALALNLAGGDYPEQVRAIHASQNYFRLFGASPVVGRTFLPEEDRPGGAKVVVLSNGVWKRRFGADPQIAGKTVILGGDPYTVVGVLAAGFYPEPTAEVWIPLQADPNSTNHANYLKVAGRLKPGVSLDKGRAQMQLVAEQVRRLYPQWQAPSEGIALAPMRDVIVGEVRPALLIMLGAVTLVLLIACANVANLQLARALGRQREMAIRSALGAARGRLVRQLLVESMSLALLGGMAGLLLATWGVPLLLAASPGTIPRVGNITSGLVVDSAVFAFTLLLASLTGIAFGLVPALQLSRPGLETSLRETRTRAGTIGRHTRARNVLVVAETALALILLVGAVLLIRTFTGLRSVDPGFDTSNLLTMEVSIGGKAYQDSSRIELMAEQVTRRLESLPGVVAASAAVVLPLRARALDLPFIIEGKPLADGERYNGSEFWRYVGPHYFSVFRIPLRRGRIFDERDGDNGQPVVIVNEAMARRYWGDENPVGRQITIGKGLGPGFEDPTRQIVGVVADVREGELGRAPEPVMYVPVGQVPGGVMQMVHSLIPMSWGIRTHRDPLTLRSAAEREFLAVDSQLPVGRVRTMEQVIADSTARESFNMLLLGIFAAIALLLAALGIYGLMSYTVEQRTHEIGVRMALGAGRRETILLVAGTGLKLAAAGIGLGVAGAYGVTRLMSSLLFGVRPTDTISFAGVAAGLLSIALVASLIPALRASRLDPVSALKQE